MIRCQHLKLAGAGYWVGLAGPLIGLGRFPRVVYRIRAEWVGMFRGAAFVAVYAICFLVPVLLAWGFGFSRGGMDALKIKKS